jgi:hypothetical protein
MAKSLIYAWRRRIKKSKLFRLYLGKKRREDKTKQNNANLTKVIYFLDKPLIELFGYDVGQQLHL